MLIAGDVYDKTVPSAEAVALLDDFLVKLADRSLSAASTRRIGWRAIPMPWPAPSGIQALSQLGEGRRLVGIISHVAGLKERIDRQIVVKKDRSEGSRAEVVC